MKDDRTNNGAQGRKPFGPATEKELNMGRDDYQRPHRSGGYTPPEDVFISRMSQRSDRRENPAYSERAGGSPRNETGERPGGTQNTQQREKRPAAQPSKSKDDYRKEHVRKTRKQRKKRILISTVSAMLAVICIIAAASYTVLFRIDTVNVQGSSRYSIEEILEASGIKIGDNLLRTGENDVSARIEKALPYIGKATLKKELPSTVTICVEQAQEVYSVKDGNSFIRLDGKGKILAVNEKSAGKTKLLLGIKPSEPVPGQRLIAENSDCYNTVLHMIKSLEDNGISIIKADVRDENDVKLFTGVKLKIDFGSLTDIEEKLQMSVVTVRKLLEENAAQEGTVNVKTPSKAFYMEEPTEPVTEKPKENKKENEKENEKESVSGKQTA